MRRAILSLCLSLAALQLSAQPLSDETILSDIRQHPYYSAGCHNPYIGAEYHDTPAPTGYKAFYISHIGRHGSRYQTSRKALEQALKILDTLHVHGLLTASGDSLCLEMHHIYEAHSGMEGMLTGKGTREHTQIARNLVRRCPEVFNQADRPKATFRSTAVARTIQSMAGFSAGIIAAEPQLEVEINSGFNGVSFKKDSDVAMSSQRMSEITTAVMNRLFPSEKDLSHFISRVFKDSDAVMKALGVEQLDKTCYSLFAASCGAGCLDIKVDPLRFFTAEELFAMYKVQDVNYNIKYGTLDSTRASRAIAGKMWARLILDQADAALEGNGHCADFRFAHDSNVGPMMNLLGIGPFQYTASSMAPYRDWQSYRYICMGSNLQLIFYHNNSGDILVKALYNEKEIDFPGLKARKGVYYEWKDVRRYMVSKIDGLAEVPEHYVAHLKTKAEEIKKLQKNEADGFYFLTDTHYPSNYGYSPALIENLEHSAGKRPVVFGGDVLTYLDDMDNGVALQIATVEQIKCAAPYYPMRGNHDFVNYTGKKEWITKERKALQNWDTAELMARYTSGGAVRNQEDPYSTYYYYDNPKAGIRYVIADSMDSVRDNRLVNGISMTQLKWIINEAVMTAPKNWHIMFFSHIPVIKSGNKSIEALGDMIASLSFHKPFTYLGETFDFSARPDLVPLGIVCAHKHKDFSVPFGNGISQINVEADCNYDRKDAKGTVREQSFDYFSISKDFKTISTVRIGDGTNRKFDL